ncbi:sporulation histidine kinase inhibitor Sda [Robertmurraya korlensis]|uniref:sporulation histidine kinase inhibitor Sda n=1 Tax=Robertmurraya korlensis TaxID=519977 RepID=UPI00203A724F|nr:sporulation histidine kinase inhibitor Sda [Robertmurraya korlensis]MCM3600939.1 sporulation histidine kinase inhibitor Sda [Robertmurraya korlensis]
MNSLHRLDDEQLSNLIIQAIKLNLENDFLNFLKNEAIRRLTYSQQELISKQSLQDALDVIYFKKELELLQYEQSKCTEDAIREQIWIDIDLLQSVIELATEQMK